MLSVNVKAKLAKGIVLSSAVAFITALSGCGGGGGGSDATNVSSVKTVSSDTSENELKVISIATDSPTYTAPTRTEAQRFLTQATFGPRNFDVDTLVASGYSTWIDTQFATTSSLTYKAYWDTRNAEIKKINPIAGALTDEINHMFWKKAVAGPDQLRQRMALALSEIFVISLQDGCGANHQQGSASYFDMLNKNAFGKYRDLLEAVALHPVMGCFLSHLRNQKEDLVTGRVPDENFAREVMQLFSIGLVQLNADGTVKKSASGQPIETYNADDVAGLAKVFTGWGFDCPDYPSDSCFKYGTRASDGTAYPERWTMQMRPYPKYHSTSEKRFLGAVIPAQTQAAPAASLKVALDTLANHPNVGPFIGKQLIQRFVTSNPSPAYVQRVATAFKNSDGDLKVVIKTILLDPEARQAPTSASGQGKVREPLLRVSALLRAYGADSDTGSFLVWSTHDSNLLGQAALHSPTVFNYFRPGYTPPNSESSRNGLVAPELQIAHETTAAAYVNYVKDIVLDGMGAKGYDNRGTRKDIQLEFQRNTASSTLALAKKPADLVQDVNLRLMYGTMPAALKAEITDAVTSIYIGSTTNQSAADSAETARRRVMAAILLTMASPDFQVQK